MRLRTLTLFFWGCLVATAAVAGEEHKMKIEVITDDDDGKHQVIEWHGDGTTIKDLEVGESKTITDDSGNEVTLKRTEEGLEIEVEGETIELMHEDHDIDIDVLHDKHANVVLIGDAEDVLVTEHKMIKVIEADHDAGVTIISRDAIDEETRAQIEEALKESGNDSGVMFIDGTELHGDEQAGTRREVRVIKKKVDATN